MVAHQRASRWASGDRFGGPIGRERVPFRTLPTSARIVTTLMLMTVAACDAGFVNVHFEWPNGRPTFSANQPVTIFVRAEERDDIRKPGRVLTQALPYPFSEPQ